MGAVRRCEGMAKRMAVGARGRSSSAGAQRRRPPAVEAVERRGRDCAGLRAPPAMWRRPLPAGSMPALSDIDADEG